MSSKQFCVKEAVLMAVLFCIVRTIAPAQSLGKIAVPPFIGSTAYENDAVANLFLTIPEIADNFDVIPRTAIIKAAKEEKDVFQTSGITDQQYTDVYGKELGANFVLAGTITQLGKKKLLIVSIIKIPEIQEVAGDFLFYEDEASLVNDGSVSIMAQHLIELMETDYTGRDRLAIPLVQFEEGANKQEGDALAQLLSIYLIRNDKYAVYPRTQTLEKVEEEYKVQASGDVAEEEQVSVSGGVNPEFVLSVQSNTFGEHFFIASIIDLKRGTQKGRAFKEKYTDLFDGQYAIKFIADGLSGITVSANERDRRNKEIAKQAAAERKAAQQKRVVAKRKERAHAFEQATDEYLRNTGIGISGWVGFLPYNTGETEIKKDKDTGEEKEVTKFSSTISGGGELEWRLLRYFSVQSGFWVVGYEGPLSQKELKTTVYQAPALAKLSTPLSSLAEASIYGGVGYNVKTSFSTDVQIDSLAPFAGIIGGEVGLGAGWVHLLAGIRYCRDLSESVVYINTKEYAYTGSAWSLYAKLELLRPWRSK